MKNLKLIIFLNLILSLGLLNAQDKKNIDGSSFYGLNDGSVKCEIIPCIDRYKSFIGTWEGHFQAYNKETKKMRPYNNVIIYDPVCYRNIENGDIFIVGKKTGLYPAFENQPPKIVSGLIITGMKNGDKNKLFLKIIDTKNGVINYENIYTDPLVEISVWRSVSPAKGIQPQRIFTITSFNDPLSNQINKRFVFISMIIGPEETPYWKGVITKGYHIKIE